MTENEEFTFPPPEYNEGQGMGFLPQSGDAAWMLQLIQLKLDNTSLPKEIKDNLLVDMVPYINNASMTKISPGQVNEFIGGFRELWLRYRIFKVKKKYVPELNYVMAYLRELLIMNLNKSVDGWQGDHVFERKSSYDIKQSRRDMVDKIKNSIFSKKKNNQEGE